MTNKNDRRFQWIDRTPLHRSAPFRSKQGFIIVDTIVFLIWVSQIFSPSLWIGILFSHRGVDGRYHQDPHFIDVYIISVSLVSTFLLSIPAISSPALCIIYTVVVSLFIIEIIQYHFYLIFLRPYIDPTYRQYSGVRTIINTCIAFINITLLFAAIFLHNFSTDFQPPLVGWSAWAYSVGEISGSGYGGVRMIPAVAVSLLSAVEKIIGLLFLAIIISLALNRLNMPEIGSDYTNYDPYRNDQE